MTSLYFILINYTINYVKTRQVRFCNISRYGKSCNKIIIIIIIIIIKAFSTILAPLFKYIFDLSLSREYFPK
jgi:hypothetical protein